jgi:hypothetical protein
VYLDKLHYTEDFASKTNYPTATRWHCGRGKSDHFGNGESIRAGIIQVCVPYKHLIIVINHSIQ